MKIVIVGGGISGLATAWFLAKESNFEITLFEKSNRWGGWIQSIEKEGVIFERGPRALRCTDLSFIEEIGLQDQVIEAKTKEKYLLYDGKLERVSPFFILKKGFLFPCLREFFIPLKNEEESIAEFFDRRFGKKFREKLIDPVTRGIFGGDIDKLSLEACFPRLKAWEKEKGSVMRGFLSSPKKQEHLFSFRKGMESLPQALYERLKDRVDFRLNTHFQEDQEDHIIWTAPLHDKFSYQTITVASFAFLDDILPKKGFGFLVPSSFDREFLGMSFDSALFPELNGRAKTRISLLFQGEVNEEKIRKKLNTQSLPFVSDIFIARSCIPQYTKGHLERISKLPPKMTYTGSFLRGAGLSDCIESARLTAMKFDRS